MSRKYLKSAECSTKLCGYIVNELELPLQFKWTNDDVLEWIEKLGFPQYRNTFKLNLLNGRTLLLIDASALAKMNVKDFDHIKTITKEIRRLYKIELEKFGRSISLPPKHPETHYKFYKIPTGPVYELCQRTELFKKMKLMGEAEVQLNHFEKLHQWLKHIPDFQNVRVGGIKKINLFFVKPNSSELEAAESFTASCTTSPRKSSIDDDEQSDLWTSSFLIQVDKEKDESNDNVIGSSVINLVLTKD